jgi:DNA-binding Lrp family transcriptional regulator
MMEALLKLLEEDSLTSLDSLAKMLNRSPEEVRRQIKTLEEDKVILAYKAIIDDEKAKRQTVKAVIEVKVTPERDGGFNRLASRIAKYHEVRSCFLMSGGYDLLVFVEGSTLKEVASFVSEKLATLHGVVSTATHFMLKPYKELGVLMEVEKGEERLKVSP